MTRAPDRVDISAMPDLIRLAEEVAQTGQPLVLHRGDEEVAVLVPAGERRRKRRTPRTLTPAQREAVLSTAGGWVGLIDAEQFKRDIKAARSDHRPPVKL
jgi:hypothetical protein